MYGKRQLPGFKVNFVCGLKMHSFLAFCRFKEMPEILGYELLNEPWTGDIFQDLSLLLPGNAGHQLLEPFFNAASDAIREVDDETLIFWEPVTYAYFVNVRRYTLSR